MIDALSEGGSEHPFAESLPPEVVAEDRRLRVIDIRPRAERAGGLGYVPGSRLFPADLLRADPKLLEDSYPLDTPLAIACLTGSRSIAVCAHLRAAGFRHTVSLAGGVLAWRAAGLPACGVDDPPADDVPAVSSLERFARVMTACFVASTAELAAADPLWEGSDPSQLVREICAEEQARAAQLTPAVLERAVDRVAEIARLRGFPLAMIQSNVDRMLAALRRLDG